MNGESEVGGVKGEGLRGGVCPSSPLLGAASSSPSSA